MVDVRVQRTCEYFRDLERDNGPDLELSELSGKNGNTRSIVARAPEEHQSGCGESKRVCLPGRSFTGSSRRQARAQTRETFWRVFWIQV